MPTSTLTTKNRFSARAPVRRVRDLKGGRRAVPYIPGKLKHAPPRRFHHAAAFAQSDAPPPPPPPRRPPPPPLHTIRAASPRRHPPGNVSPRRWADRSAPSRAMWLPVNTHGFPSVD